MALVMTGEFDPDTGEPLWSNEPDPTPDTTSTGGGSDFVTEIPNTTKPGEVGYGWKYYSDGTAISPTGQYYYQGALKFDPNKTTLSDLVSQIGKGTLSVGSVAKYIQQNPGQAAGIIGGLANLNAQPDYNRVGYQGSIPQQTAVRQAVPVTYDPNRRPGSGGQQYFTDVQYVPKSDAAGIAAAQNAATQQAEQLAMQNAANPAKETKKMAGGGITALARGRYLQGSTDGMADKLPASIDNKQPAKLSHGEFVVPADVVSHLGNGNSDAGAKKLYSMMDKIRMARTGTKKQGKQINPDKYMPGGSVGYASGGGVKGFAAGDIVDTSKTSTPYESNLSTWAGPYVTGMLGKGQALSEMPYQAYQGPLTAGASTLQEAAFKTAGDLKTPEALTKAATTAGDVANQMKGLSYTPGTFGNQYSAPTTYQTGTFTTDTFGAPQAQQYMNPYLQAALDPQIAEARRQAQITNLQNLSKLTQAGAYGGGRQAIMQSEADRNLASNLANITGQGYNTAYQQAAAQFNADQARKQAAQTALEQSRQFGYGQQATAAQLAAQYGLAGQQAQEQSKQFGANYGLQALQNALQAAQAQGALGTQQGQMGLQNLAQQAALGQQQRGITAEGIAADKAQFEEARDYPYKMVQFQQSLLSGLPLQTQAPVTTQTPGLTNFAQTYSTLQKLLTSLGIDAGTNTAK